MRTNRRILNAIKKCVRECKTKEGFSCDFAPKLMKELGLL